jgi:MoxR-like ATPase
LLACFAALPCLQAEDLLREAMLVQAALDQGVQAAVLEKLLPKRFKQYQKGE